MSAPDTTFGAHPVTPVGSYYVPDHAPPSTTPLSPSRLRSELRHRPNYSTSDRASEVSQDPYRDSMMTPHSDAYGTAGDPPNSNLQNSMPSRTPVQDQTSPSSLQSALAAFQSAGSRRRQTVEEGESYHFQQERERELASERARQQRIRDKAPGLKSKGTRVGEIDAVLEQVKDGWEFVIDTDFNHVDLALQLLDKSSVGKNIESFRKTKNMLSKVLRVSVDKHYQAFAASLPLHGSLLTHLDAVQTEVASARSALHEAKGSLGGVRADLVQVWSRGQVLEEMIKILDQIEYLKSVPDLLETLMSEKRLLQGSILLVRSLKIINNADMLEIGAVADLRSYLETQETALRDILTDELLSHLYLKSFWCESRWAPYVSGQQDFPQVEFETNGRETTEEQRAPDSPPVKQSKILRYLNNLNLRPNESPYDVNDNGFAHGIAPSSSHSIFGVSNGATPLLSTTVNPEADSLVYMETLLESLAVLGKLGTALDTIAQRLPGEIFALFETTVDEVEERLEFVKCKSVTPLNERLENSEGVFLLGNSGPLSAVQKTGMEIPFSKSSTLRLSALESLATRVDHEILRDFFWTLYSKLVAVVQGFRVVTEVANRIISRRDYKDILGTKPGTPLPLTEIWDQLQMEVRALIQDYLVDEQQGSSASRNPISSINEILRDGKFNRDRVKPVFRFADTDPKATNKVLKPHEDGLTRTLKDTMPGLAPGAGGDPSQTIISNLTDERILGGDQHHRLLIRPDAFHVTVLFQPTLSFLHRIADILPTEIQASQTSSSVLDEFVLKVYLPQLEEKVLDIFHHAVTGPDAFLPDPISRQLSSEPIVKASIYLLALNNSLCAMLNTSPFHREDYSRLILAVVIQFYQKCSDRFHALTADPDARITQEPRIALAAQWAQRSDPQTRLAELMNTDPVDRHTLQRIYRQETNLELQFMEGNAVTNRDLIVSVKNLASLASLQRSVSWFMSELRALRSRSEEYPDVLSPATADTTTVVTPSIPPLIPQPISDHINLPLSREMGLRFQALLKTYEQLSTVILDTLRLDLRCRAIYYLDSSMLHGTYNSHYETTEPDAYIVDLNAELVQCDEFMATHLPTKERKYVFAGLGYLMEQMLIVNAKHLRRPTAFGIKKVLRNILALQQVVKTLTDDVQESDFDRAKEYFSLFFLTPQEMLDGIRQKQTFTFRDYETMLNLQCSVDQGAAADRNNYSMYLLDLQCLGMESMDES